MDLFDVAMVDIPRESITFSLPNASSTLPHSLISLINITVPSPEDLRIHPPTPHGNAPTPGFTPGPDYDEVTGDTSADFFPTPAPPVDVNLREKSPEVSV